MPESAETKKRWRKDPPVRVLLGIYLIVSICIYLLRGPFFHGNGLWWAWIIVGIGCLLIVESLVREFNIKNRWSTYVRFVVGVVLAEVGGGFIYGFGELRLLYINTLIVVILSVILFRHKFVKA